MQADAGLLMLPAGQLLNFDYTAVRNSYGSTTISICVH